MTGIHFECFLLDTKVFRWNTGTEPLPIKVLVFLLNFGERRVVVFTDGEEMVTGKFGTKLEGRKI